VTGKIEIFIGVVSFEKPALTISDNTSAVHLLSNVAWINVDGSIDIPGRRGLKPALTDDDFLKPEAIAETYWHLAHQDPSAWTLDLDLRPFKERF
jgi:hypothetical protein